MIVVVVWFRCMMLWLIDIMIARFINVAKRKQIDSKFWCENELRVQLIVPKCLGLNFLSENKSRSKFSCENEPRVQLQVYNMIKNSHQE